MAALQQMIAETAKRLRGLSVSQRAAIILGALLAGGSLIGLVNWAARPEMTPLLPGQELEPAEIALVSDGLRLLGEPFEIDGASVLVRGTANRQVLLAQLQQDNKMPTDTSIGFAELVKESNPWISGTENERRWTLALQTELARVLSQFNGVKSAKVFLNLTAPRSRFSRRAASASATVTVFTQDGERVSRSLAKAAAGFVAGAVTGLGKDHVTVIDGSNRFTAWPTDDDAAGDSGLTRRRREEERRYAEKIRNQLAYIPNVKVNVTVELDRTARDLEESTPTTGIETEVETTSDETSRGRPAEQPGVQPNVGVTAGGTGTSESSLKKTEKTLNTVGRRTTRESKPAGDIKSVSAAVNVSYSYLAGIFARTNPDADAPDQKSVDALFDLEKAKIVNQVTALVEPHESDQVYVDWHYDDISGASPPESSVVDDGLHLVQRYGAESALGLLALLSLGLTLRLAKRTDTGESFGMEIGLPKEAIESAKKAAADVNAAAAKMRAPGGRHSPQAIGAETDEAFAATVPTPVGNAMAVDGVLDGQEVDEETVKLNNMLTQMGTLVDQDADGIAALVEKWVSNRE
jgi:flagellar biosynthesis/type III secretory pathway M-ring protein FliF/YscJ